MELWTEALGVNLIDFDVYVLNKYTDAAGGKISVLNFLFTPGHLDSESTIFLLSL